MMKEIKEIKCSNCGTKITEEQMNFVEMNVKAKRKTTTLECRKCKNKIRYVHYPDPHYPDPKDMTDKELINAFKQTVINMEMLMDSDAIVEGLDDFASYYKDCLIAELERRGIDKSRYEVIW